MYNICMNSSEVLIKYLNASIPLVLTLFGSYIAFEQWRTNERKRRQDLFELRRKYIYSKSLELIHNVPNIAKNFINDKLTENSILIKYVKYSNEYGFLLKPKDEKKLENLYIKVIKTISDIASNGIENSNKNVKEYEESIKEVLKKDLRKILEKYLRIEKW